MNITSVGLYSGENEIANFDFQDPNSDNPYLARSILGLDAPDIISKFYGFSTTNRDRLYDFSMDPKEVVIRVVLRPQKAIGETYSSLRDRLYRAISSYRGGEIDIRFNTGVAWFAYLRGIISKFEAPLFSKSPEVQLTINCEDPIIRGFNASHLTQDSSPSGLEPFVVVDALSTAPHGFQIEVTLTDDMSSFAIVDRLAIGPAADWEFRLVYPFETGDIINVNSQTGERAVTVKRGTDITPIADRIAPDSVWPILFPGTNYLTFSSPSDMTLEYVEFTPEFWGV